ncbi:STAS domain-containing protein [Dactylosporangium sp. CS-047395]|uniref:STAS domain-containing protein n=1 Tax=Dactylosporangium sp. CS-047395 TaxID=3239936 RepID=UPI003D90A297
MALDRFPMLLQSSHDVALLEIAVRPVRPGGPVRVTVVGEVDALTAGSLHAALVGAAHEAGPRRIELDLSGVTFLGSAGVRTLLTGLVAAQRAGCDLALVAASPVAHLALDRCGVLDAFTAPFASAQ